MDGRVSLCNYFLTISKASPFQKFSQTFLTTLCIIIWINNSFWIYNSFIYVFLDFILLKLLYLKKLYERLSSTSFYSIKKKIHSIILYHKKSSIFAWNLCLYLTCFELQNLGQVATVLLHNLLLFLPFFCHRKLIGKKSIFTILSYQSKSSAMREKGGNRLVPDPDDLVDALKLSK